jgi:hypothetical protein
MDPARLRLRSFSARWKGECCVCGLDWRAGDEVAWMPPPYKHRLGHPRCIRHWVGAGAGIGHQIWIATELLP